MNRKPRTALRAGIHDIEDVAHWNAAPLRHSRPTLDAKMRGDLRLLPHDLDVSEREFVWVLDEPADSQPITGELFADEPIVFGGARHGAVRPEVWGDVLLGHLCGWLPPLGQAFQPPDHEAPGHLDDTRMPDRER